MGIEGLLKFLEPITKKQHISTFKDKRVAVDMMPWLYKACYKYAFELNQNIQNDKFLQYIFQMLDLLDYYKIKPICVFDGKYVKNKEKTISKRKSAKDENKQKGLHFLAQGNQQQARKYLSKCININQKIISLTINALYTRNVEYMISPYESDSQISKLYNLGLVDYVITEDSDLVIYGVKAILKLTTLGQCDLVDLSSWKQSDVNSIFLKQFIRMSQIKRLQLAILSGTDYNNSIKGIGIKKSLKYLQMYENMDNVVLHLKENKLYSDKIPVNYLESINQSKLIFLLATTYNPLIEELQFLNTQLLKETPYSNFSSAELQEIVGIFYQFNKEHAGGKINIKNNQKRQINKIEIVYKSALNREILEQKQNQNLQRRKQEINPYKINIIIPLNLKKQIIIKKQLIYTSAQRDEQQLQKRLMKDKRQTQFKKMLSIVYNQISDQSMISQSIFSQSNADDSREIDQQEKKTQSFYHESLP